MSKEEKKEKEFKTFVSSRSNSKKLALYLFISVREEGAKEIIMRAVGAGAVNQMVKAFIIGKFRLEYYGVKLKSDLYFSDGDMDDISEDKGSVIEMKVTV